MKLTDAQLYNADESGLYYRLLPDQTFVHACEKFTPGGKFQKERITFVHACEKSAPGGKLQKKRITFLLCSNADGSHKVKPMVIGKAVNPRCLKNLENPVYYKSNRSAWMTYY